MSPSGTKKSKALALGLLIAVLAGVYALLLQPLNEAYEESQRRHENLLHQISKYEQSVRMRGAYEKQLGVIKNDKRISSYFIEADTVELASAQLQQQVKQTVLKYEGQLTSTQMIARQDMDNPENLLPVTVKVNMKAGMESVQQIMHILVNTRPVMFVHDVSIKNYVKRRYLQNTNTEPMLEVAFELTTYMRPQEPDAKEVRS